MRLIANGIAIALAGLALGAVLKRAG